MFSFLLPASLREWYATQVRARAERFLGLADRQLDLMEAELADRQAFSGITVKAIEPTNRINGRAKAKA